MERRLRRSFPNVICGQWIKFADINGTGYAQPDAFLLLADRIVVFEAKLSFTAAAFLQVNLLYAPLLRRLYPGKEIVAVQVCKWLYEDCAAQLIEDPAEAGRRPGPLVWHFLG